IMINLLKEYPAGSGGKQVVHDRIEDFGFGSFGAFCHDIGKMRREFIQRCVEGRPPVQDKIDIWKTHMACLAAEESARTDGRRIEIDYTLPDGV
ncbi:MAG: hypothetical protein ACTSWM_07375, partial [Alphaproteobacteria bacterium]